MIELICTILCGAFAVGTIGVIALFISSIVEEEER